MKILVVSPRLVKRLAEMLPNHIEIIYPELGTNDDMIEVARATRGRAESRCLGPFLR